MDRQSLEPCWHFKGWFIDTRFQIKLETIRISVCSQTVKNFIWNFARWFFLFFHKQTKSATLTNFKKPPPLRSFVTRVGNFPSKSDWMHDRGAQIEWKWIIFVCKGRVCKEWKIAKKKSNKKSEKLTQNVDFFLYKYVLCTHFDAKTVHLRWKQAAEKTEMTNPSISPFLFILSTIGFYVSMYYKSGVYFILHTYKVSVL